MPEITLHIGGDTADNMVVHVDWFDRNNAHHITDVILKEFDDELPVVVNGKTVCVVYPNDTMAMA